MSKYVCIKVRIIHEPIRVKANTLTIERHILIVFNPTKRVIVDIELVPRQNKLINNAGEHSAESIVAVTIVAATMYTPLTSVTT